ncbi:hypothetical protein ACP8Y2_10295 [Herpetosiphon llansteffanensis]
MNKEPYDYKATELSPAENRIRIRRWLWWVGLIIGIVAIIGACLLFLAAQIEMAPEAMVANPPFIAVSMWFLVKLMLY